MKATELIQEYYRRFNAGDRTAFLELLADDVAHDINQSHREVGKDAFRVFMERMDRSYRERIADIVVMVDPSGIRAAVEYVVHGTYLATDQGLPPARGQTYTLPGGAFFEIRSGKVLRVTNYYNLEDWLRQVRA